MRAAGVSVSALAQAWLYNNIRLESQTLSEGFARSLAALLHEREQEAYLRGIEASAVRAVNYGPVHGENIAAFIRALAERCEAG